MDSPAGSNNKTPRKRTVFSEMSPVGSQGSGGFGERHALIYSSAKSDHSPSTYASSQSEYRTYSKRKDTQTFQKNSSWMKGVKRHNELQQDHDTKRNKQDPTVSNKSTNPNVSSFALYTGVNTSAKGIKIPIFLLVRMVGTQTRIITKSRPDESVPILSISPEIKKMTFRFCSNVNAPQAKYGKVVIFFEQIKWYASASIKLDGEDVLAVSLTFNNNIMFRETNGIGCSKPSRGCDFVVKSKYIRDMSSILGQFKTTPSSIPTKYSTGTIESELRSALSLISKARNPEPPKFWPMVITAPPYRFVSSERGGKSLRKPKFESRVAKSFSNVSAPKIRDSTSRRNNLPKEEQQSKPTDSVVISSRRMRSLSKNKAKVAFLYPITRDEVNAAGHRSIVTVRQGDIECTEDGEFFNDVIIDFYARYLMREQWESSSVHLQESVYIFSSLFLKRVIDTQRRASNVESGEKDLHVFNQVKHWARKVNLFQKKVLIFPVNDSLHWSLIILVNADQLPAFVKHHMEETLEKSKRDRRGSPKKHVATKVNLEESSPEDPKHHGDDEIESDESDVDLGVLARSRRGPLNNCVTMVENKTASAYNENIEIDDDSSQEIEASTTEAPKYSSKDTSSADDHDNLNKNETRNDSRIETDSDLEPASDDEKVSAVLSESGLESHSHADEEEDCQSSSEMESESDEEAEGEGESTEQKTPEIEIPDYNENEEPVLIFMDSLGSHKFRHNSNLVLKFLYRAFLQRYGAQLGDENLVESSASHVFFNSITKIKARVPKQDNFYDCGAYVVLFMRQFLLDTFVRTTPRIQLKNTIETIDDIITPKWCAQHDAHKIRVDLRNLMRDMEKEYLKHKKTTCSENDNNGNNENEDEIEIIEVAKK